MIYPIEKKVIISEEREIILTFYSGLTIFIGPNGSGKTRVLKQLKKCGFNNVNVDQIRYLSSNRIGDMEQYRSRTTESTYYIGRDDYTFGNKDTKKAKHQIEIAKGDFFVMDDRKDIFIKVSERLSSLFHRDMFIRWDSGNLKVFFNRKDSNKEYSITAEASGLVNVISILAALYDDEIKVLLIDEPEVSLHPQLQKFVLNEIKKVAGDYNEKGKKLIVISTHSTEMIDINKSEDIPNYIFFSDDESNPKQVKPNDEVLKNKKLNELIIRMGQSYKAAFFAKQPLLVEGVSDLLICNYFDNKYELNLGVAGTQIVPVEGKGQFPITVKLMKLIGKNPIILTDLDSFIDNNDIVNLLENEDNAKKSAIKRGLSKLGDLERCVKTDLYKLCEKYKETLKSKYQNHPYWRTNDEKEDTDESERKRLIRSITAILFSNNKKEILSWEEGEKWLEIKERIEVLFDCFEECGCFILRKGALESYYMYTKDCIFDGKPSAAIEEIEFLKNESEEKIKENYDIILKCLNYSANMQKIDETSIIKRELLAEIAPILGQYSENTREMDIKTIIKQVKGSESSIFTYDNKYPIIKVDINSSILNVKGFPLVFNKGDNVNEIVEQNIKCND